jgi:hypothetical protein
VKKLDQTGSFNRDLKRITKRGYDLTMPRSQHPIDPTPSKEDGAVFSNVTSHRAGC